MRFIKKTMILLSLFYITVSHTHAQSYRIQPGDTLFLIARRFNTSVSELRALNNIAGSMIYPGQVIQISHQNSGNPGWKYTVRPSDTLFLLSRRFGVTVQALKTANNMSSDYLWVGQTLTIPASSQTPPNNGGGAGGTVHIVKSGDTLYLLSRKYGVSVSSIQQANKLSGTMIFPGQWLNIPTSSQANPGHSFQNLSSADINLLARLVTAEAGGEPYEGQVAVAATVLNRMRSSRYPDTVPEVIYQVVNGKYQYSPVLDGRINISPSSSAFKAVTDAINGWDSTYGATGFYNPAKTNNQWVRSQKVTTKIGNHLFFFY